MCLFYLFLNVSLCLYLFIFPVLIDTIYIYIYIYIFVCVCVNISIVWNELLLAWASMCYILTFGPAKHSIPKWCTRRKWHIPMASNRKKSRRRIWLTKWDKVKAHDTLIDWCTGREWPLNCMTVISAWWRSNMSFQRLNGRLSGRWTII